MGLGRSDDSIPTVFSIPLYINSQLCSGCTARESSVATRTMAKVIVTTTNENIAAKASFCLILIFTFDSIAMGIDITRTVSSIRKGHQQMVISPNASVNTSIAQLNFRVIRWNLIAPKPLQLTRIFINGETRQL